MKKLLALVLSMLLVASCFALVAVAEEETTAAEGETTAAEGETTAAGEETTEGEAPSYSNTRLVFDMNAKDMKVVTTPTGINRTLFKSEWEGARLKITDVGDPYVYINWSTYINKADLEKTDSQSYPFVVFKLKVVGYVDDIEIFYCAGDVTGATPGISTTTDYPCASTGEIEYIMYDLTGDCEGNYNSFRFDPMGCDEDTEIYLYEMALFATEDEAIAYAGLDQEESEPETTEEVTDEETEEETEEVTTKAPAKTEKETEPAKEEGCGNIIGVGSVIAIISLGVVCIKKKD